MEARHKLIDFNTIVQAACDLDVGRLVELHHAITAFNNEGLALGNRVIALDMKDDDGVFTPAGKLASLGEHDAVNLLRQFGADESHIAMGYAAGNFTREAKAIIWNTCVDLNCVAIGVGMSKDADFRETLRSELDLPIEWLVFGATYRWNEDYANSLLDELDEKDERRNAAAIAMKFAVRLQTGTAGIDPPPLLIEKPSLDDGYLQRKFNKIYKRNNETGIPSDATLYDLQHDKNVNFNKINEWTRHCDQRYTAPRLTYEFAFIENDDFLAVLSAVIPLSKLCYAGAKNRKALMRKYQFNYYQAGLFLDHPDFRELFEKENALTLIRELTTVDQDEVVDMLRKYQFYLAKTAMLNKLKEYCEQNSGWFTGLLSNPKIGRVESLRIAIEYLPSLQSLHELLYLECQILLGYVEPRPNPLLPKHLQPLDNEHVDVQLIGLLSMMTADACFKPLSKDTSCADNQAVVSNQLSEKDKLKRLAGILEPRVALNAASNFFTSHLEEYIEKHSTSIIELNFTGSKEHKIERVRSMLEASKRAGSRNELMAVPLSQFSMFNHLTKTKPHPQSPKHLQAMTTDDVSPQFRDMVDKLLKCDELKPSHFK